VRHEHEPPLDDRDLLAVFGLSAPLRQRPAGADPFGLTAIERVVLLAAVEADQRPHVVVVRRRRHARDPDDLQDGEVRRVMERGDLPLPGRPEGRLDLARRGYRALEDLLDRELWRRFS
jgi:hypothetical protein